MMMGGRRKTAWLAVLLAGVWMLVMTAGPALAGAEQKKAAVVAAGKQVSIEYTLTLKDKSVVDSNVGGKPLTYQQGAKQIIPGLEKELAGMRVGERKQVVVKPADGYGKVHKEAFLEVDKEKLPPEALKVGAMVQGRTPGGQPLRGRVAELREKTAVIDFNHPLAGKTLYFDVKVVGVK